MQRPSVARVGHVTHHSIELSWKDDLQRANDRLAAASGTASKPLTGDARVKVQLEQRTDKRPWTGVYL